MQLKRSVYSNWLKITSFLLKVLMKTADVICSVNVMPSVFDRKVVIIAWKSNLKRPTASPLKQRKQDAEDE